jgi:hypothetical protein
MLQKLLVALFATTFALGAFAQGAPKSESKAPTSTEKKADKKHAKGEKKAKASKAKMEAPKTEAKTK